MVSDRNNSHEKHVRLWEEKNTGDMNAEEYIALLANAFRAIEQRCQVTLNPITVSVVIDRVLREGQEKYPLLSNVLYKQEGLDFGLLIKKRENYQMAALSEALRYLLVKLLTVMGNITAEVLTPPLHDELLKVTFDAHEAPSEQKVWPLNAANLIQGIK